MLVESLELGIACLSALLAVLKLACGVLIWVGMEAWSWQWLIDLDFHS